MTRAFVHRAQAVRVRFEVGALEQLAEEVDAVGLTRVMVICGPSHQELGRRVADLLGDRVVAVLPEARMRVPVEVASRAGEVAASVDAEAAWPSAAGRPSSRQGRRALPVEGLYASYASPITSLMAEGGARALATALPDLATDGTDLEARAEAL